MTTPRGDLRWWLAPTRKPGQWEKMVCGLRQLKMKKSGEGGDTSVDILPILRARDYRDDPAARGENHRSQPLRRDGNNVTGEARQRSVGSSSSSSTWAHPNMRSC